jgi:peptidoglycan/xylan/chitin deacetylase (PgdA/CDA1 family)
VLRSHPPRAAARYAAIAAVAAAGAHFVPGVVSLGQWAPVRALPAGWCRWRGPDRPALALTFDDGPVPGDTERTLDRLDELGAVATFFCLGEQVLAHPVLTQEIAARGHEVGVHGFEHAHHFARPPAWIGRDLDRAVDALLGAGLPPPRWFRPPYGQTSGPTLWAARRRHLEPVLWSGWAREWKADQGTAAVRARLEAAVAPGAIVLLHDTEALNGPGTLATVLDALGPVVAAARERGLEPVTLTDLVAV